MASEPFYDRPWLHAFVVVGSALLACVAWAGALSLALDHDEPVIALVLGVVAAGFLTLSWWTSLPRSNDE